MIESDGPITGADEIWFHQASAKVEETTTMTTEFKPETPFNAIVIERDLISTFLEDGKPCTVLYLTLIHADDELLEKPRVVVYAKRFFGDVFAPNILLRKGHSVRVRELSETAGQWFVTKIEFDAKQLAEGYIAELSK